MRVLIIDRHALSREGARVVLGAAGHDTAVATQLSDETLGHAGVVDVVLLATTTAVGKSEGSVADAIADARRLRQAHPKLAIVLHAYDDQQLDELTRDAVPKLADAAVSKTADTTTMLQALEAAAAASGAARR